MKNILFESKNEFRKYCKNRLEKVKNKNKRNYIISKKIMDYIDEINAKNILLYISLSQEVSTSKLIKKLRIDNRYNIFVPFMEGVSFKMVKFRLPLNIKKFNIKEPKNSFAKGKKIDLAIVPVLGVDGAFRRIGFGKGMYDRFFESLPYKPKIAFVELSDCITTSFVGESHDIQADIYITPYFIKQRGKDDN